MLLNTYVLLYHTSSPLLDILALFLLGETLSFCNIFITNSYYKYYICFRIITPSIFLINYFIVVWFMCPEIFFWTLTIKIEPASWSFVLPLEDIFLGLLLFIFNIQLLLIDHNNWRFNIIQIPTWFFRLLIWWYWFISKWAADIGWRDLFAWSSPANSLTPDTGQAPSH